MVAKEPQAQYYSMLFMFNLDIQPYMRFDVLTEFKKQFGSAWYEGYSWQGAGHFIECDNSSIVVAFNKHYNVAFVPPLLQILEAQV